ncbi:MAG: thiamine pyrophosphate-dependent acetolactate synthase large subunit-like protein [Candidatus Nanohaloarchaea archaeon]|jgi:thiamine pyrophosphate-dependent acetolactate synthase large subunit-like protein
MVSAENIINTILDRTNCSKVFTYPGTPPAKLYKEVERSSAELVQGVREQHLTHLAQTRYYKKLEQGNEEIPVIIVSGEMGEAMMMQGLLAGSITSPCLVIVAESRFEHVDNSINIAHQTDRGSTHDKLDNSDVLRRHENVHHRVLLQDGDDLDDVETMIQELKEKKEVGIVHVPIYSHDSSEGGYLSEPEKIDQSRLQNRWNEAEKPMIVAGRGAKDPKVRDMIENLSKSSGAPLAVSIPMEGYFEDNYVGRIGMMGTPSANQAFKEADLVLSIGTSMQNVITSFGENNIQEFREKTVQVEPNPRRRSFFVGSYIEGSAGEVLSELNSEKEEWLSSNDYGLEDKRKFIPEPVNALGQLIREDFSDKVVTLGVGNSVIWLPYSLGPEIRKETSRSGSMGEVVAGLNREENPILVLGDGELEMDLSLIVEAQYRTESAALFIINNQRLGLVTEIQEKQFDEKITPKDNSVNFQDLGESFKGVESFSAEKAEEVDEKARKAINSDKISLVEIKVEEDLHSELFDVNALPDLDN